MKQSSVPVPVPSRADVMAACALRGPLANGIPYNSDIWVKYGTGVTEAEAILQQFVNENADHSIVYTPKVYDYFTNKQRISDMPVTYIVMERVYGEALTSKEDDTVLENIAAAVRHIWELPLPPQASIGPLAGQVPYDRFFSDYGAGRTFQSTEELQAWINEKLKEEGWPDRVDLPSERCICHCDLSQFNILRGNPVIILDWGMSGVYPRIFDEFALFHQFNLRGSKFAKALHKKLFGDKLPTHLRPLAIASRINTWGS
ncbi:hypothetical protein H109_01514 [Trichophyton interdigitale MR816]|uniref:Aminoglycoside phosphotransferase domain-containing protein n=1 Tax=Trichophyton interdigitale (strain MR816) TaxID=1215338 RepID=A0A059JFR4_TRIIM|nr:hypothetical protein H101_06420 [Trichophyton interdigitale H6]KDB26706.1 hypothetical protein H109_01514 [Trichophyton interdigitale MR816]